MTSKVLVGRTTRGAEEIQTHDKNVDFPHPASPRRSRVTVDSVSVVIASDVVLSVLIYIDVVVEGISNRDHDI